MSAAWLAHAGGWDEILLPAVLVLLVFAIGTRRRRDPEEVDPTAPCEYCGRVPPAPEEHCEECGFSRR